ARGQPEATSAGPLRRLGISHSKLPRRKTERHRQKLLRRDGSAVAASRVSFPLSDGVNRGSIQDRVAAASFNVHFGHLTGRINPQLQQYGSRPAIIASLIGILRRS